jgi:hypothetical protein
MSTTIQRKAIWYDPPTVRATYEEWLRFYPPYLKSQYRKGNLTDTQAIDRHSVMMLSQELMYRLSECGTPVLDFLDWLQQRKREKDAADIAALRQLVKELRQGAVLAIEVEEWLQEREEAQAQMIKELETLTGQRELAQTQ